MSDRVWCLAPGAEVGHLDFAQAVRFVRKTRKTSEVDGVAVAPTAVRAFAPNLVCIYLRAHGPHPDEF